MEQKENPSTRDRLAQTRTELANQRTFLAYIRTALASFSAGVAIVQFIDCSKTVKAIGVCLIILAPVFLLVGYLSFRKYRNVK